MCRLYLSNEAVADREKRHGAINPDALITKVPYPPDPDSCPPAAERPSFPSLTFPSARIWCRI